MLKILDLRDGSTAQASVQASMQEREAHLRRVLPRASAENASVAADVQRILDDVRERGDDALRERDVQHDGVALDRFRIENDEMVEALRVMPPLVREAMEEAVDNIRLFHEATRPHITEWGHHGIVVREVWKPIDRVGCYVPGGRATYPSAVLMTTLLARVAGVESVALCTPPQSDGSIAPLVLAAAALANVDDVYAIGGAQAIAAMAYGTAQVRAVDMVCGPGDLYVTTAQRLVRGIVGVPSSCAGPSEVVVVADESTSIAAAAIDIVMHAEHGPDGLAWFVTWSHDVALSVCAAIEEIVAESPRKSEILSTLEANGFAVIVDDAQSAIDVVNVVAPACVEVMTVDPEVLVPHIRHAGAVFTGDAAPASIGEYLAGPSHVLPAHGAAKFSSALSVRDFLRAQHIITTDQAGLARISPLVSAFAEAEGRTAHAHSVKVR